jgi:hypothetical protein
MQTVAIPQANPNRARRNRAGKLSKDPIAVAGVRVAINIETKPA